MSGITLTLRALYEGECRLEHDLLVAAERHRAEHEVHHVAVEVARWSREHAGRIADLGATHGLELSPRDDEPAPGPSAAPREKAAQALGRSPEPGLALLHDLRDLHLAATANSLHWEMLAQAAQATRDAPLLALATACHPQTLRQMLWTNTLIKTLAPQLLSSR